MAAKVVFETYCRRWKRYAQSSAGSLERWHIIFAGFLEAGRLVKESAVLRYVKSVARQLASLVYYRMSN